MTDLRYGYSMITEQFVERYADLATFKKLITEKIQMIDSTGKIAFSVTLEDNDWKLIYFALYKLYKNHWFKSTDGELRDLRIADKIYNEYPHIKFERAVEEKLVTQNDLSGLLTSRIIQNTAQHPSTDPSTDSNQVLGYIDGQQVGIQQNSIADLVNTSFTNRSSRLENWAKQFKNMFVFVFTADSAPYFINSASTVEEEI